MIRRIGSLICALALASGGAALAQVDSDLALIPPDSQAPPQVSVGHPGENLYLENALTAVSLRDDLAVPVPAPYDWQERLLLDLREAWPIGRTLRLFFGDRLNTRAESDLSFPDREDVVNDLREAYVQWQPAEQTYLAVGRINLKNGIALGYNPTDYFKARTVTEPLTADPSVLRDDRLGTVMLRLQQIWRTASVTLAFAPRLHERSPIYANTMLPRFDLGLGRTNSQDRWLLASSLNFVPKVSPQVLLYHDDRGTQIGLNLSLAIGASIVAYAEESGGSRGDLIAQALRFGRETGALPGGAPDEPPASPGESFKNETALGASYTRGHVTWNLEYHLNQAGFTSSDWRSWFAIGSASAASLIPDELWYVRSYALDQQEQSTEQSAFLRVDWVDAQGLNLELSGFVNVDLHDGSGLAQGEADYYLSNAWTVGLLASGDFGSRQSDFGSLPTAYSILFFVRRYF